MRTVIGFFLEPISIRLRGRRNVHGPPE